MKTLTLAELAQQLGGKLEGDGGRTVTGVAPLNTAGRDQVSFLSNPKYTPELENTLAAAVIVSRGTEAGTANLIRVDDPYLGFAMAMDIFYSEPHREAGISDGAWVHPEASIGEDPSIHPMAVVCRGARVGSRVTLMPGVYVGPDVTIGDDTTIHPNVVLERNVRVGSNVIIHGGTVVGSGRFGFAREGDRHRKIVHAGTVVIEDDVEIGAGCTIDRAVMGETVIGRGTKLDNLIQIGHNVRIGPNCILVAQAGVAGSSTLEADVTMAGQSGVAGHLNVGRGAVIMGKASVFKDLPPGAQVAGTPAIDALEWKRSAALFARLDDLRRRIASLEKILPRMGMGAEKEDTD